MSYRIYKNDGAGGPIDYGTVVATVTALTWLSSALPLSSDTSFAVRTYDPGTGLDDGSLETVVRIVVDAAGTDASAIPSPALFASVQATSGGTAEVRWAWNRLAFGGKPTGFRVWKTVGSVVNYAAGPDATIPYDDSLNATYLATLTGLADGTTYAVGIKPYNAAGVGLACDAGSVVGRVSTGPDAPDEATATTLYAP